MEKDYEAENAADTLLRAEEIKRSPAMHKKAIRVLEKRQKDLANIEGLSDGAKARLKRRGKM